jgi:hypothetical protein
VLPLGRRRDAGSAVAPASPKSPPRTCAAMKATRSDRR